MKKIILFVVTILCSISLFSCSNINNEGNASNNDLQNNPNEDLDDNTNDISNSLVVYFSATGNTEKIANMITDYTGGTKFELVPVNPYTNADLNYNSSTSRVSIERNDPNRHVELTLTTVDDFEKYDYIFIGYPIWWGNYSWVLDDFVTNNDFTGKTMIPFTTSASSGLGNSSINLKNKAGRGNWLEGKRFSSNASKSEIEGWISNLIL